MYVYGDWHFRGSRNLIFSILRGYCPKLAFFVLFLKIANTFVFWKIIFASYSELFKKIKNSIKI